MEGVRTDELFSGEFLEEPAAFSNLEHFEAEEDLDDILDLAGGARDAIERHRSQNHDMDMKHEEEDSASAAETHTEWTGAAQVWDLLYWTDVQKSVCVCGATLLLLISLSVFSVISVCSYIVLSLLSVTISYRIYITVTAALHNHQHTHPYRLYLEQGVVLSADDVHKHTAVVLKHINAALAEVKRLYLVEDLIDSLKLAVLLWILTYVGSVFNALTLLIIGDVVAFTCPVLYKKHKIQIYGYRDLIISHIKDLVKKIQMKVNRVKNKAE